MDCPLGGSAEHCPLLYWPLPWGRPLIEQRLRERGGESTYASANSTALSHFGMRFQMEKWPLSRG